MTTAQLGKRLGISQPSVVGLERSEAAGRVQLETLQRAAVAMNCRLVYALVPVEPLETMVRDRARQIAERILSAVEHTMSLEDQGVVDRRSRVRQLDEVAEDIDIRKIWDERYFGI